MPTELDDLERDPGLPAGTLRCDRGAQLFTRHRALAEAAAPSATVHRLVPDEMLHAPVPADLVVRRGSLRLSELLADGREVTRAVLQAGAVCRCREEAGPGAPPGGSPDPGLYRLRDSILMALVDSEVWVLPAGTLDDV